MSGVFYAVPATKNGDRWEPVTTSRRVDGSRAKTLDGFVSYLERRTDVPAGTYAIQRTDDVRYLRFRTVRC